MFDLVINHVSAHSEWFRRFKAGDPAYADFFIRVDPGADLSAVVRPRTLPLLTPVETARGVEHVWTTFSDDQIDLNFANPDVLLRMVEVLLFYVRQGMTFLRLDAIAYLWKQIGTGCIHLGQTHTVVRLLRDVFDAVAPQVAIITETNVPHEENISYFGNGWDEAQLVYQFPLPPLTLHAFATGDATHLSRWAAGWRARPRRRPSSTSPPRMTASACARWKASCRAPRSSAWSNARSGMAARCRTKPTATARKAPTS